MDKTTDYIDENRQEKGIMNKRKLAHPSDFTANLPSSLIEFPQYKLPAEISQSFKVEMNSAKVVSHGFKEEAQVQMQELVDWNDPFASQLEELVLCNLRAFFLNVIMHIVKFGYSQDVAKRAISGNGLYIGEGDPVSNVVHDTLNFLKGKNVLTRDIVFEQLEQLLDYTMVEMISVLREVRPSLSVGEAMWLLLICDLNISQACAAEDCLSGLVCKEESSTNSSLFQSESEVQSTDMILSNCNASTFQKESSPSHQNSPNNQSTLASQGVKLKAENASLPYTENKSSGSSGKHAQECRRHSKKEIVTALRSKFLHMDKAYRTCGKGGAKSGKVVKVSGFVVEQRLKLPSEILNQHMKRVSSKNCSRTLRAKDAANALPAGDCSRTLHAKDATSASPIVDTNTSTSDTKKIPDYCAGIPYDESLGKYVPQDHKDELILKLVPLVQELQDKLQSWNDWVHQKVMQVAHKLGKEKAELNTLRKEKQEAELFKKEKKVLEENAMKRIWEMENAAENTKSQIESTTSAAFKLEAENSLLKKEWGAAKLWVVKSMASHRQALEREQMVLKKAQSWESQRALILDELEREKDKLPSLQQEVNKEKNLQAKFEGRLEQEIVAKEKLLEHAESIRKEREQLEARANAEEDMLRKKAASDMQKYAEDIAKLEKELAELNLKSRYQKIAALCTVTDGRNDSFSRNNSSIPTVNENKKFDTSPMMVSYQDKLVAGSLRREHECVMCLSEELSVVFLPCAHQVLCTKCNELHEKKGMKDCPSCRTLIQQRIHARFAGR